MITVYIDVLFMVNFIINILIVEATALVMREETKHIRTILSSALGAVYSVAVFFTDIKLFFSIGAKFLLSALMVFCAFGFKGRKRFLKIALSFYIVSFIFGGGMFAVLSLSGLGMSVGALYSNGTIYLNIPWQILFLSCIGTYFLVFAFSRVRKRRIEKQAVFRELTIYVRGRKITTRAIIDTGNSLCDPISGVPVIVCEYSQIKKILPKGNKTLVEKLTDVGIRVRMIPFSTVGKTNGVMIGFTPEKCEVDKKETSKCVVGITQNDLTSDAAYHALLNPMLIVGRVM